MRSLCVAFQFSWASDDGIPHSRRRVRRVSFHFTALGYIIPPAIPRPNFLVLSKRSNFRPSRVLVQPPSSLTPSARFLCVYVCREIFLKNMRHIFKKIVPSGSIFFLKSLLICIFHRGCNFLLVLVRVIFFLFFNPFEMSEKMKERVR
jgi:hypothetical protein